jgi:23S rRNA (uracil1939-C5)-methyltransferase
MEMEIERLNNIGDGCGFFNKKKVFIQKSCVGDVVKFTKVKETKDYIIGNITEIVKKSNCRVEKIICPFYDKCGGCNLLHLKEEEYSNFKKNILKDTIKKSGHDLKKIELIYIGFNSRRRVVFKVKNNKIGFFEKQSNNLTEINNCLLIEHEINSVIPQLKEIIKKILVDEIFVTKYEW